MLPAGLIAGRVDDPLAALVAGLVTGAVIGVGSGWPAGAGSVRCRWILATAVGMGLGLLFGATVVGFGTSLADLAVMGALTGLLLGVAQTLALPARTRYRLGVGRRDAAALGARLDRHHARRESPSRSSSPSSAPPAPSPSPPSPGCC